MKKNSLEDLILKFNKKHEYSYDYSLSTYVNNRTNIVIICKEHGSFNQLPYVHLKFGCPSCT